ncbi:hypothetical protein [Sphingomonas sp. Leaf257]|uniref:hypothetical protein n=1 Tax=Sphingomonas sp. Leaf257 TaxID=1736309 RepID=UPI0007006ED8|nr:hypothetical protein [Sphingomonas sp. Leaf257]KQO58619.1 hypothetical protein ASF14_01400 [Sphingomonas sp. Leaf257]
MEIVTMVMQQIDLVGSKTATTKPWHDVIKAPLSRWDIDPLEADAADDEVVVTTCRRLLRLSIAATEVGARFALDGMEHDPAAWMMTPRTVFDDRCPIDACQDLDAFNRNVVLHGLGLGLDADPSYVDDLLSDDDTGDINDPRMDDVVIPFPSSRKFKLLTCWVDAQVGDRRLLAFCALVTDREDDLVERVADRFGTSAATTANYQVGFDQTTALATAMISPAMADMLLLVAQDPSSSLAAGLDVCLEQRFAA